ncbi:MAG: thioredoxin domain-containing protein [Verrucomicrobia bacterium]|nr:thioredoxin domain-containing protein [Verrucomicrobiota bacterium]
MSAKNNSNSFVADPPRWASRLSIPDGIQPWQALRRGALLAWLALVAEQVHLPAAEVEQPVNVHTNRLAAEKSPYLLQHAHNPVDWYPWGEEAFVKARREDKPIFLSVGYSTCHWCHVMAHESFEDPEVARILNQNFVAIKVDREERPDVDQVHMAFVQSLTRGGGWPMSVWLTPELKPFFGGTYYPTESFVRLLHRITEAGKTDRNKIISQGNDFAAALARLSARSSGTNVFDKAILQKSLSDIAGTFDAKDGGFEGAPKFPRAVTLNYLFRVSAREGQRSPAGKQALEMALFTLRKLAGGGIHDHLGGGFHRYSVDAHWRVPHFEKMLYDQAQLAAAYLDAFQITRDPFFSRVARDILDYVQRNLMDRDGGFYSAEDADSLVEAGRGKPAEGAYYIWTKHEIERTLDPKGAEIFNYHYGVEAKGNAPDENDPRHELRGRNILSERHSLAETAAKFKLSASDLENLLRGAKQKLLTARSARPRPHLDDKIITAWNGLMISAFARAHQVLGEAGDLGASRRAAAFIRSQLTKRESGELVRSFRQGASDVGGFVDDYANLIQGLLDLYEASFEIEWLQWAIQLQEKQDSLFWDNHGGSYFNTSGHDPHVTVRLKSDYDGSEPSPNSIAALNLLRLAQMTDNKTWRQRGQKILANFADRMRDTPRNLPQMLVALDFDLGVTRQIVLAGKPGADDTRALVAAVHRQFVPNRILLLADDGPAQDYLANRLDFIRGARRIGDQATAYICEGYVCNLPTADPVKVIKLLANEK